VEIRLLETAKEDLCEGYKFCEKNAAGLGEYFLDCIQTDIHSVIRQRHFGPSIRRKLFNRNAIVTRCQLVARNRSSAK